MCDFCEKKVIHGSCHKNGIKPMGYMLNNMFGDDDYDSKKCDGIWLTDEGYLAYDNSSGEYVEQLISISFCPFCGKPITKS